MTAGRATSKGFTALILFGSFGLLDSEKFRITHKWSERTVSVWEVKAPHLANVSYCRLDKASVMPEERRNRPP